jgi:hypothetical protein
MAVLTGKGRKHMASSKFALSGKRFPVEDKPHARDALSRVTQSLHKGNVTPAQAAKVRHRAECVLGECDSKHHSVD